MIPIARPDIGPEEIAAVTDVLQSGMIAQGKRVKELEDAWAEFVGVRHAIATGNGTLALMAIFAGIGLEPGDEVITVSHTFAATANAILSTGANPVFVDIEPDTYLIDAKKIERAITPRTRAICPVHLFGLVADMDMIRAIADRHGLIVVEDACQAHGATFRGRMAGSFGHGAFSLYATKNMTTAEGGFVTTNDDAFADWLRLYRNQGMRARYQFEMLGYNFRMTDLAAALGLAQFAKLPRNTTRRQAIATRYDEAFGELPIGLPITPDGRTHVFHQYTLDVGGARDAIVEDLREAGVGADIYYPIPVHRQSYIMERGLHADLPVTDAAASRTLALPMFPGLTGGEQDQVIAAVREAVRRHLGSDGIAEATRAEAAAGSAAR
ncbi:MAG TPA: DegT/DnrJ/EryC1/StrS family aminotransferase [Candidatus Limnocylindrales bacterium]|nr:DegT/DnrJ/EryC1/StrS family aminotransferase [Candidatus Limnocylindrales bacterium]